MEVTNQGLDWTSDDTANWAAFLRTQTGQRLIPKIAESAPRLLYKGETNEIMICNGLLLGFQSAVQTTLDLAHMPQTPHAVVDAYPPLEDDSKWPQQTT